MTDYDALEKRLREAICGVPHYYEVPLYPLIHETADAIRDLRAERDALREAIAEMVEFATSTTAVVEIGRFALDPVKSRADFAAQERKL